jgi:hypothetical protein
MLRVNTGTGAYKHNQLHLCDMGKRAGLSVDKKKVMCTHKKQYTGASQKNIANYLSNLWGKTIHLCWRYSQWGEKKKKKKKWENETSESVKWLKCAKLKTP